MEEQDIERIIKRVFFHSEQLITQLLKERKATGDYRREVVVQEEGFVYQFVVCKHRDKYPATRKNYQPDNYPSDNISAYASFVHSILLETASL